MPSDRRPSPLAQADADLRTPLADGLELRRATAGDVPAIVGLFTGDPISAAREADPSDVRYHAAFAAIDADPAHDLVVVTTAEGAVVATLQLTAIPNLTRGGTPRGLVEGVHVAASHRGAGLGEALLRWAVDRARARGCGLLQLTSDAARTDAHRFYERLGFVPSHIGFKLAL